MQSNQHEVLPASLLQWLEDSSGTRGAFEGEGEGQGVQLTEVREGIECVSGPFNGAEAAALALESDTVQWRPMNP